MKIKEKFLKLTLALLLLFCVGITPMILVEEVNASSLSFEYQVLEIVNEERNKVGLGSLKMDEDLLIAAQTRCKEQQIMFSHTRPDGSPWHTVSPKANAENLARGSRTPQEVMNGWMNSPPHRKNILDPEFKSIGIGYLGGNPSCWVQLFGVKEADEKTESTIITTTSYETEHTNNQAQTIKPEKSNNQNTVQKLTTPKLSLVSGNKKIAISWKKVSKASGYEIFRSTKKNGIYVLIKTIKKGNTVQFTNQNLKKKTRYYYKIRSYALNNDVKVYSKLSSAKSKVTKK